MSLEGWGEIQSGLRKYFILTMAAGTDVFLKLRSLDEAGDSTI